QPAIFYRSLQFLRRDELVPLVSAAWQPAQYILSTDNSECKTLQRAIQSSGNHKSAWFDHCCASVDERSNVGNVLDDFHSQHDVESFVCIGKCLRRGRAVVDINARPLG